MRFIITVITFQKYKNGRIKKFDTISYISFCRNIVKFLLKVRQKYSLQIYT